jgi:hypothetical protein
MVREARPVLGIAAMPERIRTLARGGVYAITADRRALRRRLIARTLRESLAAGVQVLLVATPDDALRDSPALRPYREDGRLLELDARDLAGRLSGHEVRPAIDACAAVLTDPAGAFVVLDRADAFFSLASMPAADAAATRWQAFANGGTHTVLALFDAVAGPAREFAALESVAAGFAGFGVIRTAEAQTTFDLRHWGGALGVTRRTTWLLRDDSGASGGLVADADLRSDGRIALPPPPEPAEAPLLVATRRAAIGFASNPPGWRVVGSWAEAVDAARHARIGALLMHFHQPQDLRPLARAIAAVRGRVGGSPAIVVRETGARLRIAQQVALLRVGASLIVSREADPARVRMAVESFATVGGVPHEVEVDVERVLAEVGARFGGVLAPEVFRVEVERLLAGTGDELRHALLRLDAVGEDVVRLARVAARRSRDAVLCTDRHGLWIFLFGCPADGMDALLARLFGARFERLFVRRAVQESPAEIRRTLAAISQQGAFPLPS